MTTRVRTAPVAFLALGFVPVLSFWMLGVAGQGRVGEYVFAFTAPGSAYPTWTRVALACVLGGWAVAAVLLLVATVLRVAAGPDRARTALTVVLGAVAAVLLLPYAVPSLATLGGHPGWTALCLPFTAAGAGALAYLRRRRGTPLWLLPALAGWGALVANGFAVTIQLWHGAAGALFASSYTETNAERVNYALTLQLETQIIGFLAAIFATAAGLGTAFALARRHLAGVAAGMAAGGAIGAGAALTAAVATLGAARDQAFAHFVQQMLPGALLGPVLTGVVLGAGFGAAAQLDHRKVRRAIVACAVVAAVGGNLLGVLALRLYTVQLRPADVAGTFADLVIVQPAILFVTQLPLIVVMLMLASRGLRQEREGLVTDAELADLADDEDDEWDDDEEWEDEEQEQHHFAPPPVTGPGVVLPIPPVAPLAPLGAPFAIPGRPDLAVYSVPPTAPRVPPAAPPVSPAAPPAHPAPAARVEPEPAPVSPWAITPSGYVSPPA